MSWYKSAVAKLVDFPSEKMWIDLVHVPLPLAALQWHCPQSAVLSLRLEQDIGQNLS